MSESRRDELLGAALGGDLGELTPGEREELEALLRDDPAAAAELDAAQSVIRALGGAGATWSEVEPPASLQDRVLAATSGAAGQPDAGQPAPPAPVVPLRRRDRRPRYSPLLLAASAAALLGAGVGGGFGLSTWLDRPVQGPAGTLGALEPITFTGAPEGAVVTASVVAHTWGTETVFDEVSGLETGETYEVVLVADDGSEVGTGSFEAVAGAVDCRMTSATMREEVDAISVRTAEGTEVMSSSLPAVEVA